MQDVVAAGVIGDDDEDEEAEERHQQIAREVEADGDAGGAEACPASLQTLATATSR